jgi:hypothetical protein
MSAPLSGDGPDFLIIGAAKSGTTALFEHLREHPDVFLTDPKEPHYFALAGSPPAFTGPGDDKSINRLAVTSRADYLALFDAATPGMLRGEASVSTLYSPQAAARIHAHNPAVKLICLLRDPADRAFSAYSFMRTRTWEPEDEFRRALDDEERRIADGWQHIWHYKAMGLYGTQLARFDEIFPREQMLVLRYEDFASDSAAVLRRTYDFLGLDAVAATVDPRPHRSGEPRVKVISRMLTTHHPAKRLLRRVVPSSLRSGLRDTIIRRNIVRRSYDHHTRAFLVDHFEQDLVLLESLTGLDTSAWRAVSQDPPT